MGARQVAHKLENGTVSRRKAPEDCKPAGRPRTSEEGKLQPYSLMLTPTMLSQVKEAVRERGQDWLREAIAKALKEQGSE